VTTLKARATKGDSSLGGQAIFSSVRLSIAYKAGICMGEEDNLQQHPEDAVYLIFKELPQRTGTHLLAIVTRI
jgi:hypothetical protein